MPGQIIRQGLAGRRRRALPTMLIACSLLAPGGRGSAAVQDIVATPMKETTALGTRIDTSTQAALARLMLAAMDHANRTGDDKAFRTLVSQGFQASNINADVNAGFDLLRQSGIDPEPFLHRPVKWKTLPTIADDKFRLVGSMSSGPVETAFEMNWNIEAGNCRLVSVSLTLSPV